MHGDQPAGCTTDIRTDSLSSLITDEYMNVFMKDTDAPNPDVFAIGDAAMVRGSPLPATAQVAYQKARYLTKKLDALGKDKDYSEPFKFHNAGSLAYVGDWNAIYDRSKAESGPKTKEAGRLAWLLWRSAYFTRTISIRNKCVLFAASCLSTTCLSAERHFSS